MEIKIWKAYVPGLKKHNEESKSEKLEKKLMESK